mgnify:CR=1 FL=1
MKNCKSYENLNEMFDIVNFISINFKILILSFNVLIFLIILITKITNFHIDTKAFNIWIIITLKYLKIKTYFIKK